MKHATKLLVPFVAIVGALSLATAGWAYWTTSGSGSASGAVGTLAAPVITTPVTATGSTVTLNWSAVAPPGSPGSVTYSVTRSTGSLTGTCASSFIAATTCNDTGVPNGANSYTVTAKFQSWTATSAPASVTVTGDTTAPTQSLSMTSGSASLNGTVISYKGNAAGSFTLIDTVTDSGSGPASATYPDINTAAWTHANQTVSTPTGGPYTSTTFTWNINPTNPGAYTITGKDIAGNPVTTVLTFVNDSALPTQSLSLTPVSGGASLNGTTVYYKGNAAGSFTLTDTVTDSGSGPASATYPDINTAAWTHASQTVSTPSGGPYTSTQFSWASGAAPPASYTITGTDRVGNAVTSQLTFVNDSNAPANSLSVGNQSGGGSNLVGTTVYYQGAVAGSFTITNALTDAGSGPGSSTFGNLGGTTTGFTFTGSTVSTPSPGPYVSATFSWAAGTSSGPTEVVTGTDKAGNTVTTTLTFVNDTNTLTQAAPTFNGGHNKATFSGTAPSSTNTVTIYFCTPAITPCTSSSPGASVTTSSVSGGNWSIGNITVIATPSTAYTSTAYQTDSNGVRLMSSTQTWTT